MYPLADLAIEELSPAPQVRLALATFAPVPRASRREAERTAVQLLLCHLLGVTTPPSLAHTPDGSPLLPESLGYSLSISHTQGCVGILLAPSSYCPGLDIERYRTQLIGVAARYISPLEWSRMQSQTSYPEDVLRTLLWTAKEACYKLAHPLSGSLLSYEVERADMAQRCLHLYSAEQAREQVLHYLFRPPYVVSFGYAPLG